MPREKVNLQLKTFKLNMGFACMCVYYIFKFYFKKLNTYNIIRQSTYSKSLEIWNLYSLAMYFFVNLKYKKYNNLIYAKAMKKVDAQKIISINFIFSFCFSGFSYHFQSETKRS